MRHATARVTHALLLEFELATLLSEGARDAAVREQAIRSGISRDIVPLTDSLTLAHANNPSDAMLMTRFIRINHVGDSLKVATDLQ